jgi:tripartite-type tricarboxylate transporter receptor subunit TctC
VNQQTTPRTISRRRFCGEALAAGAFFAGVPWAPTRAATETACPGIAGEVVRWIVPTSPGGGYDRYSRLLQPFYEKRLEAQIVIENISGAGMILGSRRIMEAEPDGKTQGILNAGALLMAQMTGDAAAPHPIEDFTALGRISRTPQIWATAGDGPFGSLEDLYRTAAERPLVIGITEFGATNPVNAVVTSHILGLDYELVPGYQGSSGLALAAVRGEVDLVPLTYAARVGMLEAGELRALLQVSCEPIADHEVLAGVPLLGGEAGAAALRARALGRDVAAAIGDAHAISAQLGAGRLAAAPPGLPGELAGCIEARFAETLGDPACREAAAAARLRLDYAPAQTVRAELAAAIAGSKRFIPLIEDAKRKVRG